MQQISRRADTARNEADLQAMMAEFADAMQTGSPLFAGGSFEIQYNIISKNILGLPETTQQG